MRYLYYPGCSLKGSGRAYEESLLAVFEKLDVQIEEIEDWNCCGATSYMSVDEGKAFGLAARNLGLASSQINGNADGEIHIIAPCSACYLVLLKTQKNLSENSIISNSIKKGLLESGLELNNSIKIRHPLDVIVNDIGYEKVAGLITNPLKGLKVVSYYGCQIIRPYEEFDKQHYPTTMDELVKNLGAEAVDWPLKTRCCGGMLMSTIQEIGMQLNFRLLQEAKKRKADLMVTTCPLCHINLDGYQDNISNFTKEDVSLPVIYFTQLMGLAFGIPEKKLGLHRQIVPIPDLHLDNS